MFSESAFAQCSELSWVSLLHQFKNYFKKFSIIKNITLCPNKVLHCLLWLTQVTYYNLCDLILEDIQSLPPYSHLVRYLIIQSYYHTSILNNEISKQTQHRITVVQEKCGTTFTSHTQCLCHIQVSDDSTM